MNNEQEQSHVDDLKDVHICLQADDEKHGTAEEYPVFGKEFHDGGCMMVVSSTYQEYVDNEQEQAHVDDLKDVHICLQADDEKHGTAEEDPVFGKEFHDGVA